MSIINKHRPKAFSEVIGQDAAVKALQRAIVDKSAQTFLITGPSGVGKTTLARIAAKTAGAKHGDILKHNGVVHTGVEDMRALLETVAYRPNFGEASAIIVDEFHGLSKQAMNAILDCTEEPPEWLYWFICTTEPTKVPAPIKTRSVHIALKPVRDTVMKPWLKETAKRDKLSTKFVDLCVESSGGSPRQALVNLAAVQGAKDEDQATELLASAEETTEMVDLAKLLTKGGSLEQACSIIKRMKDSNQNPEAVRVMIVRYLTAVALNTKSTRHLAVLEEFSTPFPPQDGLAPVLVGCSRLLR
jgi:DNA polymerase III gamma/tau subunit